MHLSLERAYPTPLSNSTLLPLLLLSLTKQRHTPDLSIKIKKEYDYVIVGSGTAGSVVAARLSELPCVSVLVLEAGHEPPLLTEVPALGKSFWFTDVDWQHKTAPQKYTGRSLINRQIVWPSGKMLGGSSSFNDLLYVRGNRKNYDDWAAQGAEGWGFKDVYPYFLKLENNKDREFLANGYHTTGGPVSVHRPNYESEIKRAVHRAATSMGYKVVDSNAEKQTGFYDHQATLTNNQRCSTAKAYLVPAENRTNLDILPNAMVTKILIKRRQATGVQFHYKGREYEVMARTEVILSAGTVNTAQLLMLSGVGPKEVLQRLNIPVVADLPVGKNLQDHVGTDVPFVLNPYLPDFEEKITDPANIHLYIRSKTGPLASAEGTNYLAFLKGQAIYSPVDFPNYQLYFSEMSTSTIRYKYGLKPEVFKRVYGPYIHKPLFVCQVSQLQPRSRGVVTLRSKDPYDHPIIDPNYLQDARDVEDIVQGMKTCQRIGTSTSLRKLGARPFKTLIPGCERYADDEDKYFTCQLRSIAISFHNPVGTAKMGDPRDDTTVVDPQLRVKFVKGLRVVDASVMPIIPSGNTMIPTIMVAEKASEMIKESVHCYRKDFDDWDDGPIDSTEWSHEETPEVEDKWDKSKETPWPSKYGEAEKPHNYGNHWQVPKGGTRTENDVPSYTGHHRWCPQKEHFHDQEHVNLPPKYFHDQKHVSLPPKYVHDQEHVNLPHKRPWSGRDKYYLDDYIKSPDGQASTKDGKDGFWKPYSWYKQQTERILKEIGKIPPYTTWENKHVSSWQVPHDFKMSKSIDELVKLADMVPDEMYSSDKWGKSFAKPEIPWYRSY